MSYEQLELERRGSTALVTIQNPPANTWNRGNLAALRQLVEDLNADRGVRSLVITGSGEKFFSAGADLNQFASGDTQVAKEVGELFGAAFETLSAFRGISIAAINGYAMGGGLEAALACDLRVAEEKAVMALPEAVVGLLPCAGGTQLLTRVVGEPWAKRMILLGERVDAATAHRIGLVDEVVPAGKAVEKALELAAKVEKQSPDSVAACKRLIQGTRSQPLSTQLPAERAEFIDLFKGPNQKEGTNAFLEKRAPQWK
jgi:enoyl-CoA hydratase/carnithine racemase